jgi:hypothetical protein
MSGCILPLAPEFQDPPASENFAPRITEASPALGMVVTPAQGMLLPFKVTLTDPNLGDDLYVRWVVDYPPYSTNTRPFPPQMYPHSTATPPPPQDVSISIDCVNANLAPINQHQLMVIVADRPFADPGPQQNLANVTTPGIAVVGTWTFNLNCGAPAP